MLLAFFSCCDAIAREEFGCFAAGGGGWEVPHEVRKVLLDLLWRLEAGAWVVGFGIGGLDGLVEEGVVPAEIFGVGRDPGVVCAEGGLAGEVGGVDGGFGGFDRGHLLGRVAFA